LHFFVLYLTYVDCCVVFLTDGEMDHWQTGSREANKPEWHGVVQQIQQAQQQQWKQQAVRDLPGHRHSPHTDALEGANGFDLRAGGGR
jgi:hypothetical protein